MQKEPSNDVAMLADVRRALAETLSIIDTYLKSRYSMKNTLKPNTTANMGLRSIRLRIGKTQAEAAQMMLVSRSTFNRWETGSMPIPYSKLTLFKTITRPALEDIMRRESELTKAIGGESYFSRLDIEDLV